jgi:hypothetical protein
MNQIKNQISDGFSTANNALKFLGKNWSLLLFPALSTLFLGILIITANDYTTHFKNTSPRAFILVFFFGLLLALAKGISTLFNISNDSVFIYLINIIAGVSFIFFDLALAYATHYRLQNEQVSTVAILKTVSQKIGSILLWGIPFGLLFVNLNSLIHFTWPMNESFISVMLYGASLSALCTAESLLIAIMVYEPIGLYQTLKRYLFLGYQLFWQFFGGFCFFLPSIIFPLLLLKKIKISNFFAIELLVKIIGATGLIIAMTTIIIFGVLLYRRHQRETMQDFIIDAHMTWMN